MAEEKTKTFTLGVENAQEEIEKTKSENLVFNPLKYED